MKRFERPLRKPCPFTQELEHWGPEFYLSSYQTRIPLFAEEHNKRRNLSTAAWRAQKDHIILFQLLLGDLSSFWSAVPDYYCRALRQLPKLGWIEVLSGHVSHSSSNVAATIANLLTYAECYDILPLLCPRLRQAIEYHCESLLCTGLAEHILLAIPVKTEFYLIIGEMLQSEIILGEALRHYIGRHLGSGRLETVEEIPELSSRLDSLLPVLCNRFYKMLAEFKDVVIGASYTERTENTIKWMSIRPSRKHPFQAGSQEQRLESANTLMKHRADFVAERHSRAAVHNITNKCGGEWPLALPKYLWVTVMEMSADIEGEEFQGFVQELRDCGYENLVDIEAQKKAFRRRFMARVRELAKLFETTYLQSASPTSQWPMAIFSHVPYVTNLTILDHEWPWAGKPELVQDTRLTSLVHDRFQSHWVD